MNATQARLNSFHPRRVPKNPLNKSTSTANTVQVKWPHPSSFKATPQSLADAGFFYKPNVESKDNVSCFLCEKELNSWSEDDDPADVHFAKCGDKCAWASLKCGLARDLDKHRQFISEDPARIPSSKAMENLRLQTFISWPHDLPRKHGANSKKMAKAGFVFTPELDAQDDSASCFYCDITLSGWDPEDDPTEEHHIRDRRAGEVCLFFSAKSTMSRSTTKAASRASVKPKAKSKSTKVKQEPDQSSEGETDTLRASTRATRSTKPVPSTSRRTTKAKAVATGSEVEDQSGSEVSKPPKKKGRATKTKEKIAAIEEEEEDVQAEEDPEPEAPLRKSTRGKSKAKAVYQDMGVEDEESPKRTTQARRQTRSKSKVKPKVESDSDVVIPKNSRSRLAGSDYDQPDPSGQQGLPPLPESEDELSDLKPSLSKAKPKRAPSRAPTKAKKAPAPPPVEVDPESSDAFEIPKEVPKSKAKVKVKPRVVESESEEAWQSAMEEPTQLLKSTNKAKKKLESASVKASSGKPTHVEREEPVALSKADSVRSAHDEHEPVPHKVSKKPAAKPAPFHDKTSNQRVYIEAESRLGSQRTSVGSKENASAQSEDRETESSAHRAIIDISDDADEVVAKKPDPSQNARTAASAKLSDPKTRKIKKAEAEVVVEKRPPEQAREVSDIDMEVDDEVVGAAKPSSQRITPARTPAQNKPQAAHESDSAMEVDDFQNPLQPSTPPRAAPIAESNPFTLVNDHSNLLSAFQEPYGKLPIVFTLTEEEKEMTIEEWTKRELETQLEKFKRDGFRRIQEFKDKAVEVRRQIEAL